MQSTVTLGELAELPIEQRCEFISSFDPQGLYDACADNPLHPGCGDAGFAERLAWGLAFNVDRTCRDVWPPDTLWSDIWKQMSTPSNAEGDSWVNHLAKSISCEHRDDWQHPVHRPIDLKLSGAAFYQLFRWQQPFVLKIIKKKMSGIRTDEDDLVNQVFMRAFNTYWSPRSKRRFLGVSLISTFLHTIARRVCADYVETIGDEEALEPNLPGRGNDLSPTEVRESRRRFKDCLRRLKPHQALVYLLVNRRKMQQKELARRFNVSAAAISQWLTSAELKIKECLAE